MIDRSLQHAATLWGHDESHTQQTLHEFLAERHAGADRLPDELSDNGAGSIIAD
jgi:hypothetical protein